VIPNFINNYSVNTEKIDKENPTCNSILIRSTENLKENESSNQNKSQQKMKSKFENKLELSEQKSNSVHFNSTNKAKKSNQKRLNTTINLEGQISDKSEVNKEKEIKDSEKKEINDSLNQEGHLHNEMLKKKMQISKRRKSSTLLRHEIKKKKENELKGVYEKFQSIVNSTWNQLAPNDNNQLQNKLLNKIELSKNNLKNAKENEMKTKVKSKRTHKKEQKLAIPLSKIIIDKKDEDNNKPRAKIYSQLLTTSSSLNYINNIETDHKPFFTSRIISNSCQAILPEDPSKKQNDAINLENEMKFLPLQIKEELSQSLIEDNNYYDNLKNELSLINKELNEGKQAFSEYNQPKKRRTKAERAQNI